MTRIYLFLCIFLTLCLVRPAYADQVYLSNGDKVSGEIQLLFEDRFVTIKTPYSNRIYIPWDQITSVQYGDMVYGTPPAPQQVIVEKRVYTPPPQQRQAQAPARDDYIAAIRVEQLNPQTHDELSAPLDTTPVISAEQNFVKSRPVGAPVPVYTETNNTQTAQTSPSQPAEEKKDRLTFLPDHTLFSREIEHSGEINIGVQFNRGNGEEDRINADALWKVRRPDDRITFTGEINRVKDEDGFTEDNRQLTGTYDYFFKPKWFFEADLELEQDDVEELDLRTIFGLGIGHQFYESDERNLQVVAGLNYLHEEYANDDTESSIGPGWELKYDQKVWKNMKVFHNHDITAPFDSLGDFLLESKTGLKMPFTDSLSGTTEVEYDYDADPAPGVKEEDMIYRFKVGYNW